MFKYVVLLGALAFAAPGLAVAQDSLADLTANDPPDSTFHGPTTLPPSASFTVPACSVLATDPDDLNAPNGTNGDDKNPTHGNKHCHLSAASR